MAKAVPRAAAIARIRRAMTSPYLSAEQRQTPEPFPARCEHRVGDRWEGGRRSGLADAARLLITLYEVNFNRRRLVHAQHAIGIEIRLLHAALVESDLAVERRRHAENESP